MIFISFHFSQYVSSPAHKRGITSELVLYFGLGIIVFAIVGCMISDHLCLDFNFGKKTIFKIKFFNRASTAALDNVASCKMFN